MTRVKPGEARGCLRPMKWGCGCLGLILLAIAFAILAVIFLLNRPPKSYPPIARPMPPPTVPGPLGGGLDGFDSPYLGHTGSWDGKGGAMWGKPKTGDLDKEAGMGLRWTFMPVYWRALEPNGPVDLDREIPPAWAALDAFVVAAQKRKLNILMQAPVMGGNAGGPPAWAGRREKSKSAPANMDAAAAFAGKLAKRYAPGGTLAQQEGWNDRYGVRAWELDNEPNSYLVHWKDQPGDYAEFATRVAAAIRQVDAQAVMIGPSANINAAAIKWIDSALNPQSLHGSPEYRARGQMYSLGPILDVVSFHLYEGLDTFFSGQDRTIEVVFEEVRDVFERCENRSPGFTYPRKQEYWHTEGNFDFLGVFSRERRAAWRIQFLTRAFAAGMRKVMVMDASDKEQTAVRAYIRELPNPFPMERANDQVQVLSGTPVVFLHPDGPDPDAGRVWVLWASAGTGDAEVDVPSIRPDVRLVHPDGTENIAAATNRVVRVRLRGEAKMAPPVLLVDRPPTGAETTLQKPGVPPAK